MFLATTPLTEFWDKKQKILFLGPWCLNHTNKSEWSNLDFQTMQNPWKEREKYNEAARYAETKYEQLFKELAEYLNEFHRTSHSERYWRILIGPWLLRYVYIIYDRYFHLISAFDEYGSLKSWCLSSDYFITPQNMNHFRELYVGDFYNLQIYSQLLKIMGYNFPEIRLKQSTLTKKAENNNQNKTKGIQKTTKNRAKKIVAYLVNEITKNKTIILCDLYIPWKDTWKIVYGSRFQAWPLMKQREPHWPDNTDIDHKARESLKALSGNDKFSRVLVQSLPINFPRLYLEGYEESRREMLKEWRKFPRIIMSSVGWFFNENFKFFAAEATEKGSRLLACQHGGGYGSERIQIENHEVKVSDVFYSWGWRSKSHPDKVKPLPNPRLSNQYTNKKLSNQKLSKTILYVATSYPKYSIYLYSVPVSSQFDDYMDMRKKFVRSLSNNYKKSLLLRLYPHDYGRHESEILKEEFSGLHFDNHRINFQKQLFKSRIAVIDHPMTSYLEVLSFNFPCILFWNPDYWEMREEAEPYFERLRKAGVLYNKAELAAAKLEEVYDNPAHWWLSAEVQEAKNEFVHQFALGSNDWVKRWVSEFQSI